MKFIVTNFSYGTGPYLRTTDLAVAFNDELESRGRRRMGIIVPWVYGEKQRRVMLEEFSGHDARFPHEILLDAELGALLKSVFYGDMTYEHALGQWIASVDEVSQRAHEYLSSEFKLETLSGEHIAVDGKDIVVELNRSPRIRYDIAPSYFSSFGYIAEILEHAKDTDRIDVRRDLLEKGIGVANRIEKNHRMHCIAYPGTFSFESRDIECRRDIRCRHIIGGSHVYKSRYPTEILTPPIAPPPLSNDDVIEPGIFVTITGIPGLERLYADARRLGLRLYSNDIDVVPGSTRMLPHVIPNKNILFQFARSGWSSVWISMISGTPLVVPEFDSKDDPEIYFNNCAVEELGIGIIYRGQPLEEIIKKSDRVKAASARITEIIKMRWGTLDGNRYSAKLFADDFLAHG